MQKKDYLLGFSFFLLGIITRIPFLEHFQSHWDGPQYSIAVVRYSLEQQTPAIPGYPLYEFLGKVAYFFFREPHSAILAVSVLGAGISAFICYIVGKILYSQKVGILSTLIFLSAPAFYFFGITAYPYGWLAGNMLLFGCVSYLMIFRKKKLGVLFGILTSYVIGFRPQEVFFIAPLFMYTVLFVSKKEQRKVAVSAMVSFLVWFVPYMSYVSGLKHYIELMRTFPQVSVANATSESQILANATRMIRSFFLSFGISIAGLIYYPYLYVKTKKPLKKVKMKSEPVFYAFWTVPALLFNLFIRTEHAGHQMAYIAALLLLIPLGIWRLSQKRMYLFVFISIAIVLFNLFWFFRDRDPQYQLPYAPSSFHESEIRKNDLKTAAKLSYIQKNIDPKTTIILTSPDDWRIVMYHLKNYEVDDLDGLFTSDSRFAAVRRTAYRWNSTEKKVISTSYIVPKNVATILLYDDSASSWVLPPYVTIPLAGNSTITLIPVYSGEVFHFRKGVFLPN